MGPVFYGNYVTKCASFLLYNTQYKNYDQKMVD